MPSFTRSIINVCIVTFIAQLVIGDLLLDWFALWPADWAGHTLLPLSTLWQVVTYSFLHGSLMHLGFNMFALWMFGTAVEHAWGPRGMAATYFTSVVTGALAQLVVGGWFGGGGAPVIGASAGVFGVLLVYALLFPRRRIVLLIPPIPMPARVFVGLYAGLELMLGVFGNHRGGGVAHFAHLGGLLGGLLVFWWFGRRGPRVTW